MNRVPALIITAGLTLTIGVVPPAPAYAAACLAGADNDFDGDGVRDRAVAAPYGPDGGRVVVTYSSTGTTSTIDQQTDGVPGAGADDDLFGFALASYDANGDGCDDLVVGGPGENVGGKPSAGTVWIIPGAPGGLNTAASASYDQDSAGFPGAVEAADLFGYSLAAGTTGTQRYLVIGAPGEKLNDGYAEGQVYYLQGGAIVTLHQDKPGVADDSEPGDWFGESVAATPTHVAVGVAGENGGAGAVALFTHTLTADSLTPLSTVTQDTAGVSGGSEAGDGFGGGLSALPYRLPNVIATGTLLAVSATGEDLGTAVDAGLVHALFIDAAGGVTQLAEYKQSAPDVEGNTETDDLFGTVTQLTDTGGGAYATPATALLTLTSAGAEGTHPGFGAVQVFRLSGAPGDGDVWIAPGHAGLPSEGWGDHGVAGSTPAWLYLPGWSDDGAIVFGLKWTELLAGTEAPARTWPAGDDLNITGVL